MALSDALTEHLQTVLSLHAGENILIKETSPVNGGYISKAHRLHTDQNSYFIKFNNILKLPEMFAGEAYGLQLIAKTNTVKTPGVIAVGYFKKLTYILMEWIEPGMNTNRSMQLLGQQLAALHMNTAPQFGLDRNFASVLLQSNNFHTKWDQFFVKERLQPMVKLATEKGFLTSKDNDDFENLYFKLSGLFPEEPPALVHGDLWLGNCLFDTYEQPYLVDPAVYYGYREVDIAMTTLFGGFGNEFYSAYQEVYPLQKNWEQRAELWNLYPLLMLVWFGGDYIEQIRKILRKYL